MFDWIFASLQKSATAFNFISKIGFFLLSLQLQLFDIFMRFNKKKIAITLGVLLVLFASSLATFYYFRDEILKITFTFLQQFYLNLLID